MMNFELLLHFAATPPAEAIAFYLPGKHPEQWLNVLTQSGLSLRELRLLIVPQSRTDLSPRGVLVRSVQGWKQDFVFPGQPYQRIGNKLYLPMESRISPPVAEEEWESLISSDLLALVWHPQAGLIGFEQQDELKIVDLFRVPELQPGSEWTRAQPGLKFNSRLISITAVWPESPGEMLAAGADGIGSKSSDLSKLKSGWRKGAGQIAQAGARLLATPFVWLADQLSKLPGVSSNQAGSSKPSTPSKWKIWLQEWTNQFFQASEKLLNARAREIDKLMKMLEESPDQGLQYAIPMNGTGGTGTARPSGTLTKRSVNFNLNSLFGSGAGDLWQLPPNTQFQLMTQYRKLAEREIQLGRYQRAAYIYAELLNDLNTAAATLVTGRYYREAAVLYRDKLYRHMDAAKCLEQGGLLTEAVIIYEKHDKFDLAGDLYTRLEQPDQARAAYELFVVSCLKTRDYLKAAETFEVKLKSPDQARTLLLDNWRDSPQGRVCLMRWFELSARLGRHAESAQQIEELKSTSVTSRNTMELAEGISDVALTYPDGEIRAQAADATRVVVSRAILQRHAASATLLEAVSKLNKEDLLLSRDVMRFRVKAKPEKLKQKATPQPKKTARREWKAELVEKVELINSRVRWSQFHSARTGVFAFGIDPDGTGMIATTRIEKELIQYTSVSSADFPPRAPLFLVSDEGQSKIYVGPGLWQSIPVRSVAASQPILTAPHWQSRDVVGMAHCSGITWTIEHPSLVLQAFDRHGTPVVSRQLLPPPGWELGPAGIPMHARGEGVYVGLGSYFIQLTHHNQFNTIDLGQEITSLAGSFQGTLARIAVLHENGGCVTWPSMTNVHYESLGTELVHPQAAFLRDGRLVVSSNDDWRIYLTSGNSLELLGSIRGIYIPECTLLGSPEADEIIVCTQQSISVLRIEK